MMASSTSSTTGDIFYTQIMQNLNELQGMLFKQRGLLGTRLKKDINCEQLEATIKKIELHLSLFKIQFDNSQLNVTRSPEPLSEDHREKSNSESSLPSVTKMSIFSDKKPTEVEVVLRYMEGLQVQNRDLARALTRVKMKLTLTKTKMKQAQPSDDDDVSAEEMKAEYLDLLSQFSEAQTEIAKLKKELDSFKEQEDSE